MIYKEKITSQLHWYAFSPVCSQMPYMCTISFENLPTMRVLIWFGPCGFPYHLLDYYLLKKFYHKCCINMVSPQRVCSHIMYKITI